MQVSVGVYSLVLVFFLIIIPGFLGRKFYYSGEFSKQLSWSNNIFYNFLSTVFAGVILLTTYSYLVNCVTRTPINIDDLLNKFDKLIVVDAPSNQNLQNRFDGFTTMYKEYIPLILVYYLFSAFLGWVIGKLVILFDLDTKYKFFRYSNTWHYLFSGRLRNIKSTKGNKSKNDKVKHTYLDILVAENGDKTTLYSGLYANYDLSFSEYNKLEKIYLYKALRYKKTESGVVKREIPGDVFAIFGDKIININTTYILYSGNEKKEIEFNFWRRIAIIFQIILVAIFFFFLVCAIFSINPFHFGFLQIILQKSVLVKISLVLILNMTIGLFTSFDINEKQKKIKYIGAKNLLIRITTIALMLFLVYYFSFKS